MTNDWLIAIIAVLVVIIVVLLIILILYRRQMNSICRQLRVHRNEDSTTDYWLDVYQGPFKELRKELTLTQNNINEKEKEHRKRELEWQRLVSNVSHDIRTPITSVSGYFQLFLENDDPVKREKYANIITGRLNSFQDMLEDFYIYSTASADDRKVETENFDIVRTLTETLFLFYEEIEQRFGEPKMELPSKAMCIGNKNDISRVITNIIKNALLYGSDEFRIIVKSGTNVDIYFENGMKEELSEEDINHVFDRTYRADSSRNSVGTGLGLCIVRELVKNMNGSVHAYKKEGNIFGICVTLSRVGQSKREED